MTTKLDEKVKKELQKGPDVSIIHLVDYLVEKAQISRASDIHIDPSQDTVRIRLRIDGVLQNVFDFPKNIHGEVISRIKVLARLRTDEHQATQDGRFRHQFSNAQDFVDIRVSIAPTYHGENCVMRLLSDKAENFDLESLGFSESDQKKITDALKKPYGMILATGPTGSGKTTTLYTLIKMLNSPEVSIITIEDPIEYAVNDIEQIQVNPRTSLTFANGLRSILRQDPNIIMVGEIRDAETANIAVNTALTGHLLLSTLHTNDSATTLPRLLDMGIETYLVASTVSIAIGQRLVRKICDHCKEEGQISEIQKKTIEDLKLSKPFVLEKISKGKGCTQCNESGYSGRVCINEVLVADNDIKDAILQKASASDLKKIAIRNGMTTMLEDGLRKVGLGLTTIEEVLRVIQE
jgi:type II secretory ATPase GspE/PulE/Tfp pilus assembly ATPase PilB-like protein